MPRLLGSLQHPDCRGARGLRLPTSTASECDGVSAKITEEAAAPRLGRSAGPAEGGPAEHREAQRPRGPRSLPATVGTPWGTCSGQRLPSTLMVPEPWQGVPGRRWTKPVAAWESQTAVLPTEEAAQTVRPSGQSNPGRAQVGDWEAPPTARALSQHSSGAPREGQLAWSPNREARGSGLPSSPTAARHKPRLLQQRPGPAPGHQAPPLGSDAGQRLPWAGGPTPEGPVTPSTLCSSEAAGGTAWKPRSADPASLPGEAE